jgi:hypothetical protein
VDIIEQLSPTEFIISCVYCERGGTLGPGPSFPGCPICKGIAELGIIVDGTAPLKACLRCGGTGHLGPGVSFPKCDTCGGIGCRAHAGTLSVVAAVELRLHVGRRSTLLLKAVPNDIDHLPQSLRQQVPQCDAVILTFVDEAVLCYKANALLGCAFLVGAASEKGMGLLFQTFGECIVDPANRSNYFSKTNKRTIAVRYEEFTQRFKSCKSRPLPPLDQDIDILLGTAFQFYRMTRNEVGHPDILPSIQKPVLQASIGQMVVYIDRIYGLMAHFRRSGVEL